MTSIPIKNKYLILTSYTASYYRNKYFLKLFQTYLISYLVI